MGAQVDEWAICGALRVDATVHSSSATSDRSSRFSSGGLLTPDQALAFAVRPELLQMQETRWFRYATSKGEVDIMIPQSGIVVECKTHLLTGRTNWEEALGQGLWDRTLPSVQYAYIAVPESIIHDWMVDALWRVRVGLMAYRPSRPSFKSVVFQFHPRAESL